MVNQVFLIGRLVRDPELFETTNKTEVAKITLAIQKGYKNQDGIYEADYINCTLWRGIAKSICDYCKKGDTIAVRGKLESNRYEKDGKMVYSTDVIAEKIELGEEKSKFVVKTSSEKVNIDVPVGGEHFVYNALCGFMVGKVLGLTAKEIQNGISKFELTKKRMDIRVLKNGATLINDSYNASYESMKASLKYLSSRTDLRKIAVLGDMLELGDFSKELHEKVGEEVANDNIDVLICRGEFAKNIISKANKNKKTQCILLQNNEEILSKLQEILKEGDGVLIKASNGMKFYEICQKL